MYVAHLSLHDFRSYPALEVDLEPGVTSFVGRNGHGKTNIVEAIDYLSRLSSHRVAGDLPLVRKGATQAVVRAAVVRDDRRAVLEVEINPGKSNRARVNRGQLPRARELIGLVRTVVFAPDDLALVKGDPTERRHFADDLLVLHQGARYAGTRSDYDRVLKQRTSLLKTARVRGSSAEAALSTLEVWDERLARLGAEIMAARSTLVDDLNPLLGKAYEAVARGATRDDATLAYKPSFEVDGDLPLEEAMLAEIQRRRPDELDRGISLVGPHRDDIVCSLGELPVKGYASHGESWSFALAMRLASYELLRSTGDDPVLILDDVFAELDTGRRAQLAELVAGAEQVLVTAAVSEDIPEGLRGRRFDVADGVVSAVE
ncbi:DNA replication/repair protein RecF [Marmoricola sp. URHB0036]|uniref:DNA replication/repair protein RecF n=1 Tax=Marmoricola sp. URHB0036 TaxID=1298863 RepID=UPI0003F9DD3F|nr:DNA replication/repair protein RecF [Marmoricola sp. URHB0036]